MTGRLPCFLLLATLLGHAVCLSAKTDGKVLLEYDQQNIQQVRASIRAQGFDIVEDLSDINAFVVQPSSSTIAAAAAAGATTAAAQAVAHSATLQDIPGVLTAAPSPIWGLPVIPLEDGSDDTALPQEQQQAVAAAAAGTCSWPTGADVDYGIKQDLEGVPWGVTMVQADEPEMEALAKQYKNNVLYCVMDSGLDVTNQDFKGAVLNGSSPVENRGQPWSRDDNADVGGHGTHVSGIIAAVQNGKGIVGVSSAGAHLFQYRIMPRGEFQAYQQVAGWKECMAELDRRKAAHNSPKMKLVISMSYGGEDDNSVLRKTLENIAQARNDIMFFAAAGNEASRGSPVNYPAAWPDVIAIAAVDALKQAATFSNRGSYVSLAAPGVKMLSTIPLAFTKDSDYYNSQYKDVISTQPLISAVSADPYFFASPPPFKPSASPSKNINGQLVDCGLGTATCRNAAGKVCLIERGEVNFCNKVINCQNGGGIGVLLFNKAGESECSALEAITITEGCTAPAEGYVTTLALSRAQGLALRRELSSQPRLSVKVNFPTPVVQKQFGLGLLSGTSMATPNAAAVAGLVWSAHTDCSSAAIRRALETTALMPQGASGTTKAEHGTKNNVFGYGIIQGLAAHKYLQQNPCQGSSTNATSLGIVVTVRPENDAERNTSRRASTTAPQTVGSYVHVLVEVRDQKGNRVANQPVKLTVAPGVSYLKCGTYQRTTRSTGAFGVRCQVMRPGRVTVTATAVGGSAGSRPASGTSAFTSRRAKL